MGSVFKAISDPTRREILKLLNEKDLSAGEIAEHFDISKPALTKHLNINQCNSTSTSIVWIYVYFWKKGVI